MYDLNPDMVTEIYDRLLDKFEKDKFYDSDFSNQEKHLNKCIEDLKKLLLLSKNPLWIDFSEQYRFIIIIPAEKDLATV